MQPGVKKTSARRGGGVWIGMMAAGALLVVAAVVGLLMERPGPDAVVTGPVRVGMQMPNFALADLQGRRVALENYRGRTVLINVWATWCPPCRYEMPDLHAFYLKHQESGFVVLAVNAGETQAQAAEFTERLGLTFPVLLDPDERLMDALMIRDYPTSILVGPDGKVKVVHIGLFTAEQMEEELTPHLSPTDL